MHVTFVTLGMELLGVEYLSSYLKSHGHETSLAHNPALFDDRFQLHMPWLAKKFNRDDRIVEKILDLDPDLLGFSCLTNVFAWSVEISRRVREKKKIPTVFGGVHPSAVPDFVMTYPEVDFVCQGEGEKALLALANDIEQGGDGSGIPNIWSKSNGTIAPPPSISTFVDDLDALPFPDKELFAPTIPSRYVYRMMTGRGCPYRCTFCFNSFFAALPTGDQNPKHYLRRRSVDNCLQELVEAKERFDYRSVEFHDDIFTMNKDWLRDFLPRFKSEVGVPWVCETHSKFMDDETAKLLKECGCVGSKMGVQSLDKPEYKRKVLKRVEKEKDIIRTFEAYRKAKLQLDVDHIFGLPDESPDANEHALEFYRRESPGRIACFWLTYFPGTVLTDEAYKRGEISDEQLLDIKKGNLLWYHQVHAMTASARAELKKNSQYMVAFQVMPAVPKSLRGMVKPSIMGRIPFMIPMSRFVMAVKMLVDWVLDGNFGAGIYFRLYFHHILGKGRRLNVVEKKG